MASEESSPRQTGNPPALPRFLGLGAIAAATLLAEVALTRAFSISLYHHLAFVVVSTALLGFGAAGIVASTSPRLRGAQAELAAGLAAVALAVSLPVTFTLVQWLEIEPLGVAQNRGHAVRLALAYVLLSLPFFASGLAVAKLLEAYRTTAPRLYAADLIGAALGSLVALPLINVLGSRGALVVGAGFAALGAGIILTQHRARWVILALGMALFALSPLANHLPLHISTMKTTRSGEPFQKVLQDDSRVVASEESAVGRVDHVRFNRQVERLIIDAGAAAVRIPLAEDKVYPSDATLPYEINQDARVLIIGSGAGWEVREALHFGAQEVFGVEINPRIADAAPAFLMTARATLVRDEGRSYLERQTEPFDAIVMVHTISNAATGAGALQLTEDYLLTEEAIDAMFDRLTDRGVLFITRPESQLPRLLNTVRSILVARGLEPRPHLSAWIEMSESESFYGALIVAKRPLAETAQTLITTRITERRRLRFVLPPSRGPASTDPLYADIVAGRIGRAHSIRLEPATDDRPFFHQRRSFFDVGLAELSTYLADDNRRMGLENQPVAELSVLVLLVETTVVGAILLLIPVVRRRKALRGRRIAATLGYFCLLGCGFMLVEIALVQRMSLLLGAPTASFAIVFGGLLFGAGLGSRFAARREELKVLMAASVAALAAFSTLPIVHAVLSFPFPARAGVAIALLLPIGFALGAPFPLGIRRVQEEGVIPWALAANGIFSIAGTGLALIFAAELGFRAVLLISAGLYGIAAVLFRRL